MFHEEGDLQRKSGEAIGMCEPVTAGEITYRHEGECRQAKLQGGST